MPLGKKPHIGSGELILVAGATSLPTPPVEVAGSGERWNSGKAAPSEFDFEIWASASVGLIDALLVGGVQVPTEIASDDVDAVLFTTDEFTVTGHGLQTGHGPIQFSTTDTLPAGIEAGSDYWAIRVDDDTLQLSLSIQQAVEGDAVSFTDAGAGTHTLEGSSDNKWLKGSNNSYELRWLEYGYLGLAHDGIINLTASHGYATRIHHRPRTVLYGVQATLSAATPLSISLYPVHNYS